MKHGIKIRVVLVFVLWNLASLLKQVKDSRIKQAQLDTTLVRFSSSTVQWAIAAMSLSYIFRSFGVAAAEFSSFQTAIGVAVGVALKDSLSNLVAGYILAVMQPFRVGDRVQVANAEGWVIEIGTHFTFLNSLSHTRLCIPNSAILSGGLIRNSSQLIAASVDANITTARGHQYGPEAVQEALMRAMQRVHQKIQEADSQLSKNRDLEGRNVPNWWRFQLVGRANRGRPLFAAPKPLVLLLRTSESALHWRLRVWCRSSDRIKTKDQINLAALKALRHARVPGPPSCCATRT